MCRIVFTLRPTIDMNLLERKEEGNIHSNTQCKFWMPFYRHFSDVHTQSFYIDDGTRDSLPNINTTTFAAYILRLYLLKASI